MNTENNELVCRRCGSKKNISFKMKCSYCDFQRFVEKAKEEGVDWLDNEEEMDLKYNEWKYKSHLLKEELIAQLVQTIGDEEYNKIKADTTILYQHLYKLYRIKRDKEKPLEKAERERRGIYRPFCQYRNHKKQDSYVEKY